MDANKIFTELLDILSKKLSHVVFDSWFSGLSPITVEQDKVLIMETTEKIALNIIEPRYSRDIKQAFEDMGYPNLSFKVFLKDTYTPTVSTEVTREIILSDLSKASGLNPKYTFDNFIKGNNNALAFASALAVAEMPGQIYNPLFIWGNPGLGKTHLMQSIAHQVLTTDPEKKVLYITSESFTNELISSISDRKTDEFRAKYRSIDVLLIDDIQFIEGKESTQEEFFHTFNALYENGRQIVISGDRHPSELKSLNERMTSRFKSGMVADIKAPDYETRVAILQQKADMNHMNIDIPVLSYIANNVASNIRELEGALTRVSAYSLLAPDQKIDISMAQEALKDYMGSGIMKTITVPDIIDIVCERYNLKAEDIRSKKKPKEIAYPRQIAMYLSRKMTEEPLSSIGSFFGGRDHTTVIHACNKIAEDLKGPNGDELRRSIQDMEKRITGE
ncbi:MAG: chromosomal replication initiator protein DnaA [Lachnospiraceae bacterium]|nr:chromosomal replication initiator protein DnaA [Lachnospiraceae bacterium]